MLAKSSMTFSQVITQSGVQQKEKNYFPLRRDGREEAQCFPMEPCRCFISFPCFTCFLLDLWVGEELASLPRHRQHSREHTGTFPPQPAPSLLPSTASANSEEFHQPGRAFLEGNQGGSLLRDPLVLEQIAGICAWC